MTQPMGEPPLQGAAQVSGPAPAARKRRFDELDGLRGVAIIMVTLYHIWGNAGTPDLGPLLTPLLGTGYLGVTWFFVVSGFLLTYSLASAQAEGGARPPWRSFAARRAMRILPPFYVACAVWIVMPLLAYGIPITLNPLVAVSHLTLTFSLSPALQNELSPAGYWFVGTLAHLYLLVPAAYVRRASPPGGAQPCDHRTAIPRAAAPGSSQA